ncbi:MAG: hypothetical protein KF824_01180 [Fimbriimonadaceae bacterium]|nr:MAG: hypothetical protein KF824_01180 [Fimbriimonadaceae bacterium]
MTSEVLKLEYIFILVHGTFAPDAAWCKPTSTICTTLTEHLSKEVKIQFIPFNWPGKYFRKFNNSHGDRLSAAERLATLISQTNQLNPGAKVFLICHSHGGNVALYADNILKSADKISSIICLSTPFIISDDRNLSDFSKYTSSTFLRVLLFIGIAYFLLMEFMILMIMFKSNPEIQALFACGTLTLFPAISFICIKSLVTQSVNSFSELNVQPIDDDRLYIAGSATDEVAVWLALLDFAPAVIGLLLNKKGAFVTAAIAFFLSLYFSQSFYSENLPEFSKSITLNVLSAAGIFIFIFGVVNAIIVTGGTVMNLLLRGHFLGYGYQSINLWFKKNIYVARTPNGVHRWYGYTIRGKGLQHSRLYNSVEVARDIALWIRNKSL